MKKSLFGLIFFLVGSFLFGQSADVFGRSDVFGRADLLGEKTFSGIKAIRTWDEALSGNYGDRFVLTGCYLKDVSSNQSDMSNFVKQFANPSVQGSFDALGKMYEDSVVLFDTRVFSGNESAPVQRVFLKNEQIDNSVFSGEGDSIVVVVEVCERSYSVSGITFSMGKSLKMITLIRVEDWVGYAQSVGIKPGTKQEVLDQLVNPDGWAEFLKSKQ